jgi:hypothetical protein
MPPTATTDTSAAPTLDQAFEQAKAEHSPAPESKTPAAAEHAPSAKTSETSDGKPAATSTPAAQASTATTEGATDDTTLISTLQYDAILSTTLFNYRKRSRTRSRRERVPVLPDEEGRRAATRRSPTSATA